jgi:hypothetical protein
MTHANEKTAAGTAAGWIFLSGLLALIALWGCAAHGPIPVAVVERQAVGECTFLDTLAANSDMGAFQIHPKLTYEGRDHVLRLAQMMDATHVVWLADYPFGSAALAYRCGK